MFDLVLMFLLVVGAVEFSSLQQQSSEFMVSEADSAIVEAEIWRRRWLAASEVNG